MISKLSNKKNIDLISILSNISLFLFLLSKTGVLKITYLEYISLLCFILSMFIKMFLKKKIIVTKQVLGYTLFGMFACLSYFWAIAKNSSIEVIPNVMAVIVFLFCLSNYITSKEKLLKLISFTVIANVMVSLKIIFLYFFQSGTAATRINQITGIYFNTVGQVIGFSIIFTFYLYKLYNKKIYLGSILVQFVAILLTSSRKSLLIPIMAFILYVLIQKKTLKKSLLYLFIVLFGIGFVLFINFTDIAIFSELKLEFQNLFKYVTGQQTNDWSINLRQFFIDTGLEIFNDNKIIGIGVNNFSYYVGNYTKYGVERYSHNNYIEMLSCLGIIGFLLYYWVYAYILSKLFNRVIKNRNNSILIIAFCALLVLTVMEWGIVSYTGCMYHTYILIVYFTLIYYKDKDKNDKKNKEIIEK